MRNPECRDDEFRKRTLLSADANLDFNYWEHSSISERLIRDGNLQDRPILAIHRREHRLWPKFWRGGHRQLTVACVRSERRAVAAKWGVPSPPRLETPHPAGPFPRAPPLGGTPFLLVPLVGTPDDVTRARNRYIQVGAAAAAATAADRCRPRHEHLLAVRELDTRDNPSRPNVCIPGFMLQVCAWLLFLFAPRRRLWWSNPTQRPRYLSKWVPPPVLAPTAPGGAQWTAPAAWCPASLNAAKSIPPIAKVKPMPRRVWGSGSMPERGHQCTRPLYTRRDRTRAHSWSFLFTVVD